MYDRILVPTDGSDRSSAAARHAIDMATKYDATIEAIHVVDTTTGWLAVSKDEVRDALRDLGQDTGGAALAEVERLAGEAGVDCQSALLEGSPADEILGYVADNDIDLVVIGAHGRAGLERRLLGSVTDRVVGACPVPVLTVRDISEN